MIYVDPLVDHGWKLGPNSHLFIAPEHSLEVLHVFAERIGLQRRWAQNLHKPGKLPHYDLTRGKRAAAVKAGAMELDRAAAVAIWRRWRTCEVDKWPQAFAPDMVGMGTASVDVGVSRVGGFPLTGDTYLCLRWVLQFFGVREGRELTAEQWTKLEALQTHVFALRVAKPQPEGALP